ncbi:global transcription factor group B1 [Trifolium repens]|nr:global transcription factor group B1 [Trifolium repens]
MNPTWPLIAVSPPSLSLCSSPVLRLRCSSSVSRNFTASLSRRVNLHILANAGFRFMKQIFNNIEQLMAYFQNHINDKVT